MALGSLPKELMICVEEVQPMSFNQSRKSSSSPKTSVRKVGNIESERNLEGFFLSMVVLLLM